MLVGDSVSFLKVGIRAKIEIFTVAAQRRIFTGLSPVFSSATTAEPLMIVKRILGFPGQTGVRNRQDFPHSCNSRFMLANDATRNSGMV